MLEKRIRCDRCYTQVLLEVKDFLNPYVCDVCRGVLEYASFARVYLGFRMDEWQLNELMFWKHMDKEKMLKRGIQWKRKQ